MDDPELRNAFHRLRDAEIARAPRFRLPMTRPVPRWLAIWRPALAAALLLIVITVFVLPSRHRAADVGSIVTWKAPTDVLLRTPGSELLSTLPRIPDIPERK
ncbi:MAG TPA: hypothetical protein VNN08_06195 [Thermoanaerobaculia bacterium]|nr:hypothetical protein [Thermoanaerobaculia bacterium]